MKSRRHFLVPLGLVLAAWPTLLRAQTPAGPEFRVDSPTALLFRPAVAVGPLRQHHLEL